MNDRTKIEAASVEAAEAAVAVLQILHFPPDASLLEADDCFYYYHDLKKYVKPLRFLLGRQERFLFTWNLSIKVNATFLFLHLCFFQIYFPG